MKYLGSSRYSPTAAEALSISRLAQPLSMTEEPDPALTNALINTLVVIETGRVWVGGSKSRRGFSGSTGSHAYWWRGGYVPVQQRLSNPQALKTLTEYTGEDYGYDQQAWKRWYQKSKNMIRGGH